MSTGIALAEKTKGTGAVVAVFLGDGTLGEGAVYESFNLASLWQLPILFVIDNNGYSQSTPSALQVAGSIRARPESFGIPVAEPSNTDILGVLGLASELASEVRNQCRPHCLLLHTDRLGPHSKGDDDRDQAELQEAWERDPLKETRTSLIGDEAVRIEAAVLETVNLAEKLAIAAAPYEL